jgi:FK506-binding nuclear protein
MTAVAVWSIVLTPGQKETIVPQADLQIKNAALGETLSDESGRTTVRLTYINPAKFDDDDDEDQVDQKSPEDEITTVLCSLTAGKIEQSACDLILESDEEYTFELIGKNTVYLYGNYIDQNANQPPYDSDMDDEEAYNLDDVSSDVEVHPDELQGLESDDERFEELSDLPEDEPKPEPKPSKRPRDDAMDTDEQPAEKISKKKKAKKQKGEDGKAIPVAVEEKAAGPKGEKEEEKKDDKKEKKKQKAAEKKAASYKELTGGVKIRDVKTGDGKTAKSGAKVSMRYIGKLQNGKIFDQNTKGKPFTFKLGTGDVIKGWDVGVAGMQIGGEREIVVPPAMGYGARKMSDIPANSTLIFEVKCLEIK